VASLKFLVLLLGILIVSALQVQADDVSECILNRDEYAVYRVALLAMLEDRSEISEWLIADSSRAVTIDTNLAKRLLEGTTSDFSVAHAHNARNSSSCKLDSGMLAAVGLMSFSYSEYSKSAGKWFWDSFRKQFPKIRGFVMLSRVGFSADRSLAILRCELHCGYVCGEGQVMIFERTDTGWRLLKRQTGWRS